MKHLKPIVASLIAAAVVMPTQVLAKAKWSRNMNVSGEMRVGYHKENAASDAGDFTKVDLINANLRMKAKVNYSTVLNLDFLYTDACAGFSLDEAMIKSKNIFGSALSFSLGAGYLPIGPAVDRHTPNPTLAQGLTQSKDSQLRVSYHDARGFDISTFLYKAPQHDDADSNINKAGIRIAYDSRLQNSLFGLSATYIDDGRTFDALHTGDTAYADIDTAHKTAVYDYELYYNPGRFKLAAGYLTYAKRMVEEDTQSRPQVSSGLFGYQLSQDHNTEFTLNYEYARDVSSGIMKYKRRVGGSLSTDLSDYATAALSYVRYTGFSSNDDKNSLLATVTLRL